MIAAMSGFTDDKKDTLIVFFIHLSHETKQSSGYQQMYIKQK